MKNKHFKLMAGNEVPQNALPLAKRKKRNKRLKKAKQSRKINRG